MSYQFNLNYKDVPPNPTIEFAEEMLAKARDLSATEVISTGGGSTIDTGKFVAFHLGIPHTAIPTTAGTGSEVTRFAVFVKDGKKVTMEDNRLIPTNYILDPSKIVTLNLLQTASSGLDALAQGIESYWSRYATDESRHWSKLAIRIASKNLLDSYKYPDSEFLRFKMLQAANYSGLAINIAKTSICHAISYSLTTHYGVPHGIACAHTLAFFASYFGFNYGPYRRIQQLIDSISGQVKIKYDADLVANEAILESRARNTPRPVSVEIIKKALW